jgi:DNA-binding protein Fis
MSKNKDVVVQNQRPDFEDIQPVIDDQIVETVHGIFESVIELNPLDDLFEDLANRLIDDLAANSLLEYNLELSDDQKEQLRKVVKDKGTDTVRNYQANLNGDERTKLVYGLVREKTTAIADSLLSSIGTEINRGAIINARTVQANSKNEKYDEILLRKTKTSGDITVPTSVIVISSNCVEIFKSSCCENISGSDEYVP